MATAKPKIVKTAAPAKPAKAGVVATNISADTGFPSGFVSPFTRVEMQPGVRIDDGLCCVAMLTNRPLDEITHAAIKYGLAPHGPAWVYASLLIAILRDYGIKAEEKECPTLDALPDVALITANFNPATQYGRWVLWHHVRATEKDKSFHYIVDPAHFVEPKFFVTTEIQRLITPKSNVYYLEVTPKLAAKSRAK